MDCPAALRQCYECKTRVSMSETLLNVIDVQSPCVWYGFDKCHTDQIHAYAPLIVF